VQDRAVRFKSRCPRCQEPVRLGATEIGQLGVRLHAQVHCPRCKHRFVLSLTPSAPPPDRLHPSVDPGVDGEPFAAPLPSGPRKAKPPFRALVDLEPVVPPAAPKQRERPVPFAPLAEGELSAPPARIELNGSTASKSWSMGQGWKRLSDRQQKMVLGVGIGLFAVLVFGWTALQPETTAAGPAVSQTATAAARAPGTGEPVTDQADAALVVEDDPAGPPAAPAPEPLELPPPIAPVVVPAAVQAPVPIPPTALPPFGS
jgi:hypothetical protein